MSVLGIEFELPYFLIRGASPGPRLAVTAGIHGGEYPCVEAAIRLGHTIDPARVRGEVLIIPSANPTAFAARSIYVTPADGKNLNRHFPGKTEGTFTELWAAWLFRNVISSAGAYVDLHGGDMIEALVPFVSCYAVENKAVTDTSRLMAESFGIRHILTHPQRTEGGPSGMAVLTAAEAGVPSLLAEAGGQGVWTEADVQILQDGVLRVMQGLDLLDGFPSELSEEPIMLSGWSWLRSESAGLFYPEVAIGDQVSEGQPLGRVADFFGETKQELVAPAGGVVLFLVTSLAMNPGDPLLAIAY
jgi:predicted deacylase